MLGSILQRQHHLAVMVHKIADSRLDNGRSNAVSVTSQQIANQDGETHSGMAAGPQTSALSFDLLDRLLNTHNWSTYREESGNITAMHVETKEGHDRFKYILGTDEQSGNVVLLSKQKLLRGASGVS